MINKVILIGNLGKDPEMRHLESGSSVAKFPVATNESYKDKNDQWQTLTEWHNVVAWRRLSEYAERNLKKGSLVFIEGKLKHRKYQDNEGRDRYITEVEARVLRLLEKRDPVDRIEESGTEYSGSGNTSDLANTNTGNEEGQQEIEDDLPF